MTSKWLRARGGGSGAKGAVARLKVMYCAMRGCFAVLRELEWGSAAFQMMMEPAAAPTCRSSIEPAMSATVGGSGLRQTTAWWRAVAA